MPVWSFLRERIGASAEQVTLLAIGPLTDVACLFTTAPRKVLANIKEVILIASRLEGESLTVNGLVVNDFNFRMDPVAGALLLGAPRAVGVPIRLMAFSLTGQTSQQGDRHFPFNAATYPGPQPPTEEGLAFFRWLLRAAAPRNALLERDLRERRRAFRPICSGSRRCARPLRLSGRPRLRAAVPFSRLEPRLRPGRGSLQRRRQSLRRPRPGCPATSRLPS